MKIKIEITGKQRAGKSMAAHQMIAAIGRASDEFELISCSMREEDQKEIYELEVELSSSPKAVASGP